MSIIIQKYGGTSVGSVERMRHVADLIIAERVAGHRVVVVVSAMAGATNQLIKSANQFPNAVGTAAYDFLISTGENVSCGMLALALADKRIKAVPLAGWQVPIRTNGLHSRARITQIDDVYVRQLLDADIVPIISGFQGVGPDQMITTLGRGGSDTSAVAIAVALKATRCDIYTDIDGIYTADPRVVMNAQFIADIPCSIALQMATLGTKIIHPRAVECAMVSEMPLRILSSFGSEKFTTLRSKSDQVDTIGIAHINDNVLIKMAVNNQQNVDAILHDIHHLDVPIDMLDRARGHLQMCVEFSDSSKVLEVLSAHGSPVSGSRYAKVSAVGKRAVECAEQTMQILQQEKIDVRYSYIDQMRMSFLVPQHQMEFMVNVLHQIFF